jgi:hypothetical protein
LEGKDWRQRGRREKLCRKEVGRKGYEGKR